MRTRGTLGALLVLALAGACGGQEEAGPPASPTAPPTATDSPDPDPVDVPPASADLAPAAQLFVSWIRGEYALGRSPFAESGVDLYLGGRPAGHLATGTEQWSFACDQWYGASDCPVVLDERMLRRELASAPGRADVLCAPTSAALPPSLPPEEGVSLQPVDGTCADGFGVTLWTDDRGGIRAVELQLAEP